MSTVVENSKLQGETVTLRFDMLSRLSIPGETVETAICEAEVYIGTASDAGTFLDGPATVVGTVVEQAITGGTSGVIYKITCAIRTNLNNIFLNQAKIAVLPSEILTPPP